MAIESDVLVIGSGLAGMLCALRCAEHGRVLLVTKDQLPESSSRYAQGGIASVWGEDDTFESHIEDTLKIIAVVRGGVRQERSALTAAP